MNRLARNLSLSTAVLRDANAPPAPAPAKPAAATPPASGEVTPPAGEVTPPVVTPPAAPGEKEPVAPQPPEGLDPSFWDAEKGEVKLADLITDRAALKTFETTAKPKLETLAAIEAKTPAKLEDYAPVLPEGLELPTGYKFEIDPADPLLGELRVFAKKANLSTDDFKQLIGLRARLDVVEMQGIADRYTAEQKKLGTNADARRSGMERDIVAFASGNRAFQAIAGADVKAAALGLTNGVLSAAHVVLIEELIAAAKGRGADFSGAGREVNPGGQDDLSAEEYASLSPIEKANRARTKAAAPAR